MKRLSLIIAMISLTLWGSAQRNLVRPEDVKTFLSSTTYVVLENNPVSQYNLEIRDAVERSWKITPYKFITAKEFEEMRKDIDKSFLVLIQMRFDNDKPAPTYNFLSASLGAAVSKITDMPDICSVPLSYKDLDEGTYTYKLEGLILFMQNYIKAINDNPKLIKKNAFKFYNKNIKQVKSKELWVTENSLEKSTRALTEIRKNYKYTIKVVNPEDIQKAIQERNPNVLFLHKVGPEGSRLQCRVWKMIIGAEDGILYYYDMHKISKSKGDGFLAKDFAKINK
ncbi:hypothetical protein [Tenuifilum thalassicum]|uniref:DUF4837 family protein n=1 Tax=Tenuifilum thalassicum TaxID=2590900 RepID=A0A7D4AWC6_9BACT|nr:hypothetical protein [Tenuifilum thalassicum]QKG79274.1 hypothetical protein FHG85_03015 [Tenuifilum thalassicum]